VPWVVVALMHLFTAAEIGDQATLHGGVREALFDDFIELLRGHGGS